MSQMIHTHRIQPHLVYVGTILIFWQLDTPLATVLVGLVFPCRYDPLLIDQGQRMDEKPTVDVP